MTKPITPKIHGILDYAAVPSLLLAPTLFSFHGLPAISAYTAAGVALVFAIITDYPLGLIKVLPFPVHGMAETIIAPLLAALPWLLGFAADVTARYYFIAAGAALFVVWLLTDYKGVQSQSP